MLKLCPFCGGDPFTWESDDEHRDWHVECQQCSNRTSMWESKDEAVKHWNARVPAELSKRAR